MDLTYMDHLMARRREKNQRNMISFKTPSSPCANRPVEDGIWWIGSGENRRRDDDEAAPEEEAKGEDEGNRGRLRLGGVIDEATVEGESWSWEKFYDAEEEAQGSP
ncbi:hypothetical protein Dimus_020218 [Dionaea muscipula]